MELVNQEIQVGGVRGMYTVTVEKIMASTEPCKASFGHVFDDPFGPCHVCAFRAAGARPPPLPYLELVSTPPSSLLLKSSRCQVLLTLSLRAFVPSPSELMAPAHVLDAA